MNRLFCGVLTVFFWNCITEPTMDMSISSTAFSNNGEIPRLYTCDGSNISPPLSWEDVPEEAESLILIVDDPDAPVGTFGHWILYNIPPTVSGLPQGISGLPADVLEGRNGFGTTGYRGPCPPSGRHRYFYTLYALDRVLLDLGTPTHTQLEAEIQGSIIVRAELIGLYGDMTNTDTDPMTNIVPTMDMTISSTAFSNNGEIPRLYTCNGSNISPPLAWEDVPAEAESLVLIIDDPDAPVETFGHWILYNIPPTVRGLPQGISSLPADVLEGRNDFGTTGYRGPCPPSGRHRYFHKLYALDRVLPDLGTPTRIQLEAEIQGSIIARAELVGLRAMIEETEGR